jgi:glycosyltransferase involved in cell wall biosynthesis
MSGDSPAAGPPLFIYIPTYNRPSVLRTQLEALTSQRSDWPGPVRILVNDNASPGFSDDNARVLAAEYDIEIHRNAGNVQANANIALGFIFARMDEYLWILSDDDTIDTGALKALAADGLIGGPDAIAIATNVSEPTTIVRTWEEGWGGIGESQMGLISNVIYKMAAFEDQTSAAFFYHDTGFPHLAVLLATLKDRGSLEFRVVPSDRVFASTEQHAEESGDYSLSLSGMPQLAWLLPADDARRFCRLWLHEQGLGFVRYRAVHPAVHLATRAVLIKNLGVEARLRLTMLAVLEYVRPRLPQSLKRKLRGLE